MATHKSAEKRARQAERRRERNRQVKSRVKTLVKAFQTSVEQGDAAEARVRLRQAEGALRRAAGKGVIPDRRASRSVARLARRLARLGA